MRARPPSATSTSMRVAPASSAFSTSSFDDGRRTFDDLTRRDLVRDIAGQHGTRGGAKVGASRGAVSDQSRSGPRVEIDHARRVDPPSRSPDRDDAHPHATRVDDTHQFAGQRHRAGLGAERRKRAQRRGTRDRRRSAVGQPRVLHCDVTTARRRCDRGGCPPHRCESARSRPSRRPRARSRSTPGCAAVSARHRPGPRRRPHRRGSGSGGRSSSVGLSLQARVAIRRPRAPCRSRPSSPYPRSARHRDGAGSSACRAEEVGRGGARRFRIGERDPTPRSKSARGSRAACEATSPAQSNIATAAPPRAPKRLRDRLRTLRASSSIFS